MRHTRSKLETLTSKEIEAITKRSRSRKNIPLVVSKSTSISLDEELSAKVEVLSSAQGIPPNTFVNKLLKEDVNRLWKKYKKTG